MRKLDQSLLIGKGGALKGKISQNQCNKKIIGAGNFPPATKPVPVELGTSFVIEGPIVKYGIKRKNFCLFENFFGD